MTILPITETAVKQEWKNILTTAHNNGFPKHIIQEMQNKLTIIKNRITQTQSTQQQRKTWVTFTFHSPLVYKVTNLFKKNNLNIAFRATNTVQQQLSPKPKSNNPSGIYRLECKTCNKVYVGQSDRLISARHKEHIRHIRNNNPTSAYAMHILHNRHESGPAERTMQLLKHCYKGTKMNIWESLYIHAHHKQNLLIPEKQAVDHQPLFDLARIPRDTHNGT
jgi:hypothetical protein